MQTGSESESRHARRAVQPEPRHPGHYPLRVERGLFLRRWERPGSPRATLLAEDEAHLLRRLQLRLVGAEGRAGLGQVQRTEEVATEEAFVTTHLASGSLARLSLHLPPPCADR